MNSKQKITLLFFYLVSFALHAQSTASKDSLVYLNKDIVINRNCSYFRRTPEQFKTYLEFNISVLKKSKIEEVAFYFNYADIPDYEKIDKSKETIHHFSLRYSTTPPTSPSDPAIRKRGLYVKYKKNKKWYYHRIAFIRDISQK